MKNGSLNPNNVDSNYSNEINGVIQGNDLNLTDVLASFFGHEIGHTDDNNVKTQIDEKIGNYKDNPNSIHEDLGSELSPQISQLNILKDIANTKCNRK